MTSASRHPLAGPTPNQTSDLTFLRPTKKVLLDKPTGYKKNFQLEYLKYFLLNDIFYISHSICIRQGLQKKLKKAKTLRKLCLLKSLIGDYVPLFEEV
jgi:hypothetical protein